MKKRALRLAALAVLIAAVFVVFFTDLVDIAAFLPKVRLQRETVHQTSTVTLEAVRDVYAFNTVEYVHRVVFPYDYLPDRISINGILAKIREGGDSVREILDPEEYLYFRAYSLAIDVGIDPGGNRDFLVVTVVATAGFDLSGSPVAAPERSGNGDGGQGPRGGFTVETVSSGDGEIRRVLVPAPPPIITEVRVEDIQGDYPYPDVAIGADDWRRVADFVREQSAELPGVRNLLETARANGEEFIRGLLRDAGYDEVEFVRE
jgi:hypothetical protein